MATTDGFHFVFATLLILSGTGIQAPTEIDAGKVLGLFQFPGHSHFVMFQNLLKELAKRGHQVTVVSHFPLKTPLANYTDISLQGSHVMMAGGFTVQGMLDFDTKTLLEFLWNDTMVMCEKALEHPNVQKLIQSQEKYDLVLTEIFGIDCCYGLAWKFGAPVIAMTSLARMPWGQYRVGNPENPSYFPVTFLPHTTRMTFWERCINTFWLIYSLIGERMIAYHTADTLNRKILGPDVPPLDDLLYNTSLILLNTHFSLNGALPKVPAVVEVGGLHISPTKQELPQNLQEWLDGAENGLVYVSFGSLARAEEMPLAQLEAMERVLSSLDQRVLWKCDGDLVIDRLGLKELPKNMLAQPWIPQAAVLAHPKVRVFVSHGGLMGTQESVYWGKPMIVVPLFSDQAQNANNLRERGMARELYFNDITEETFGEAIRDLLDDPSYMKNAQRVSALFRDRPRTAMEEAVYWSEYVMRHHGAPHLRSAAVHLQWWQLWLLDVAAAVLASIVAVFWIVRLILRRLFCHNLSSKKVKQS